MRVVTYARVSHRKQADEGQSLVNQDRKFQRWKDLGGHTIVRSYEEQASASSIRKRRLFQQMLDELDFTKPDCIVVDSMDRFSRNLEDAFEVLKQLRQRRINVWPLEWEREQPPDIITYDSEDYLRARDEIIAAQAELKRIRTRMKRSYKGREERGATKVNRPAFGLRKVGDNLVPDSDTIWIVHEAEQRALRGEKFLDIIRWVKDLHSGAWGHSRSLIDAFANTAYVRAGARSIETQRDLNDLLESRKSRFGQRRVHENEFTGVFICGQCADEGRVVVMTGTHRRDKRRDKGNIYPVVTCMATSDEIIGSKRHNFQVVQSKFECAWWRIVNAVASNPNLLEQFAAMNQTNGADREIQLRQRLTQIDQEEAKLKARRDRAFDLLTDPSAALKKQARKALEDIDREETQLTAARQTIVTELAAQRPTTDRAERVVQYLEIYTRLYKNASIATRNEMNRALVDAIGSRPKLYRFGRLDDAVIDWPELDALRERQRFVRR